MIQINNAILHILDFSHDSLILSEAVMSNDDRSMLHFVSKQIDKLIHSPAIKQGEFGSIATFEEQIDQYKEEQLSLFDVSTNLAKTWYDLIKMSDKIEPATLLVCDIHDNANRYLVALKYKNKNGFQYYSHKENGKLVHTVIENLSILPNASQSIDECFLIQLDTKRIYFKDVKRAVQGEEIYLIPTRLLHCSQEMSCKEVIQTIQMLGDSFSETYELDPIQTQSRTKDYLQKRLEDDGYLQTIDLANFVFTENEVMANEFLLETQQMQVPEQVRLHEKFASSKSKRQRLKMDNGIEILLPAAYYDDPSMFEMIKNEDETMDIVLKGIKKIQ